MPLEMAQEPPNSLGDAIKKGAQRETYSPKSHPRPSHAALITWRIGYKALQGHPRCHGALDEEGAQNQSFLQFQWQERSVEPFPAPEITPATRVKLG